MTGRERVQARKEAARKERIRQAKAAKRAKPGGLAGMGLTVSDMSRQVSGDALGQAVAALAGNAPREDVAAWAEGGADAS